MPLPPKGHKGLPGHDQALGGLLDSLFSEPAAAPQSHTRRPERAESPPGAARPADPATLNDPMASPIEDEIPSPADPVPVVPAWAVDGFRALLFRIGRYRFAVPLVLMRGIVGLPDRITRVPGQPAWHLGLVRYRDESLVVVDLGLLTGVPAKCVKPRYLLRTGAGDVAILCDGIEDAIGLTPQDVRWSRRGKERSWLKGLLSDQMCGLLDTDVLSRKIRHG